MIRHVVLFRFRSDATEAATVDRFIAPIREAGMAVDVETGG